MQQDTILYSTWQVASRKIFRLGFIIPELFQRRYCIVPVDKILHSYCTCTIPILWFSGVKLGVGVGVDRQHVAHVGALPRHRDDNDTTWRLFTTQTHAWIVQASSATLGYVW